VVLQRNGYLYKDFLKNIIMIYFFIIAVPEKIARLYLWIDSKKAFVNY